MTDKELSVLLNKRKNYISVMKILSKDKYDFIISLDGSNRYNAFVRYQSYVVNLFDKASRINIEIGNKNSNALLRAIGYNGKTSMYKFLRTLNRVVDEDNFLSFSYNTILNIENFIRTSNEI